MLSVVEGEILITLSDLSFIGDEVSSEVLFEVVSDISEILHPKNADEIVNAIDKSNSLFVILFFMISHLQRKYFLH